MNLEVMLTVLCREAHTSLHREHRFNPVRRWKFDYAIPERKTAFEFEGGIYTGGSHTRGKRYASDTEKYNSAAFDGWKVYRFTLEDFKAQKVAHTYEFLKSVIIGTPTKA